MPRVNSVKKARKSAGKCDKCGKDIKKGDPYKWWKFRYGGKRKRCAKCPYPRASELTQSDKLSRLYGAGENIQDAISAFEGDYDVESLRSTLEEAANDVREVGEEYQESASNMEEYFQGSSQVDELNEKGENCESKADEIESAAGDLEEFDEDSGNIDVPNITEESDLAEVQEIAEDQDMDELEGLKGKDKDAKLKELRTQYAEKYQEAVGEARDEWAQEQVSKVEEYTDIDVC